MFSGIVEAQVPLKRLKERAQILELRLERPRNFNDLKAGDSIAVNGVCLTVEDLTTDEIAFAVAAETLQVTGWSMEKLGKQSFNLERSISLGDRIHGHLVAGHVDGIGRVVDKVTRGESTELLIAFDEAMRPFLWRKGSVAVNGVSLTINEVEGGKFRICLIPETLRRTNLGALLAGDTVNLEADMMARGLVNWLRHEEARR